MSDSEYPATEDVDRALARVRNPGHVASWRDALLLADAVTQFRSQPPASSPPEERLEAALRDAGRAIEDMRPDERFAAVNAAWEKLGLADNERARTFVVGVMVSAHDRSLTAGG